MNMDEYEFSLLNYPYEMLYTRHTLQALVQHTKGHPLVDLGGRNGLPRRKLDLLEVSDYLIVDKQEEGIHQGQYIKSDVYAYLSSLTPGDANFMANGFLKSEIVGQSQRAQDILRQIARLIMPRKRVLVTAGFDLDDMTKSVGLSQMPFPSRVVKLFSARK